MKTITNVIKAMNEIADFSTQYREDNSGLLVGKGENPVSKIVLALDITNAVVNEAHEIGAELIVSHHPVIYNPLYNISDANPVYLACKYDINCICSHTPLDMADGGINDIIFDMLKKPFQLDDKTEILLPEGKDYGFGKVCTSASEFSSKEFATKLKKIFNCTYVRYTESSRPIKRIAFCSGGAGSMLKDAIEKNCDAYITGDTKHDQLITAKNENMTLVDCGHFHTENIVMPYVQKRLTEMLSDIEVVIAKSNTDPANYII